MGEDRPGAHNQFDGAASTVIQAGVVHGGIHHHGPQRHVEPPRQVLPPPRHYTNNEPQLAELSDILAHPSDDGPRVAIIRGAPGSGRSTLAATWLDRHGADYPDGHFLVPLASAAEDGERAALAEMLAAAGFGADEVPASLDGRVGWWRTWSAGRRIAVVVDDARTSAQVISLLPGRGPSVVLVTEAGQLSSLSARVSARYVTIDPLGDDSARLLLERMVGRARIAAEPDDVTALIDRCAGSASALNVVGALLADFGDRPIARLAATLANDERVLKELSRDKHLSLTVVFDAAYRRLGPLARSCYLLLGAHPGAGDVALETIAAVLGVSRGDAEDAMRSLLRAMLVVETTDDRFLLAGFARLHARPEPGPDADALRRRIVARYRDRALAASLAWMPERGWLQQFWPDRAAPSAFAEPRRWLEAERVNLRAAAEAAFALGELESVRQFGIALWPLHERGKYAGDQIEVNRLGVLAADGDKLAASVLATQQGFGHRQRDELGPAAELFEAARVFAIRAGSLPAEATAVEALALVRLDQGRDAEAAELLRINLALAKRVGDRRRLALARFHLSKVESPAAALALLDRVRADLPTPAAPELYNLTKVDLWRGRKLTAAGRPTEAADALAEAAKTADDNGWHFERAQVCAALADLALLLGDRDGARAHLRDALDICRLRGFTPQGTAIEARLAELD